MDGGGRGLASFNPLLSIDTTRPEFALDLPIFSICFFHYICLSIGMCSIHLEPTYANEGYQFPTNCSSIDGALTSVPYLLPLHLTTYASIFCL